MRNGNRRRGWSITRSGSQYACREYVALLEKHQMVASMSPPGNPYDNARCERFMQTLKREEIYASAYRDMEHLRANLEDFIERYYNKTATLGVGLSLAGKV